MFRDKNIKNVFGQSDDGFRNRFNQTLSALQSEENATSNHKKCEERFSWGRIAGTLVATCMIAVIAYGGYWVWNTQNAPEDDLYVIMPGSSGFSSETLNTPIEPSPEPHSDTDAAVSGIFVWPLEAGDHSIAAPFGSWTRPVDGSVEIHEGIDITAEEGTPVFAVAAGTIGEIGFNEEYGNYIRVDHGAILFGTDANGDIAYDYGRTFYAQLSGFPDGLEEGSSVDQGEIIGYVGATGYATGPHLHFGIFFLDDLGSPEKARSPQSFFPELDLRGEIDYELRASYNPLPPETDGAFLGAYLGTGDDNGDGTGRIVCIHSLHIDVYGYVDLRDIDPNNTILLTSVTHNGAELDITSIYDGWWRSQGSSHLSDPGSEPPVTNVNVAWHYDPFTEPGEYVFRGTYRNEPFECSAVVE